MWSKVKKIFKKLFQPDSVWEYGICHDRIARRHKTTGDVQFVLWKAGEQGHIEDYWVNFGHGWGDLFVKDSDK